MDVLVFTEQQERERERERAREIQGNMRKQRDFLIYICR